MELAHFQSVAGMIDDLRSDDREPRLVAMRALVMISQTLGPERTRTELIPYLMEYLDEDDEVLRAMAAAFGRMTNEVGGLDHVNTLLSPLETLCGLDEVTVRDEAVASINGISKTIFTPASGTASSEHQSQFMATFSRLASHSEPQCRACACGLVALPYKYGSSLQKKEVKQHFLKMCEDVEVCVRRAACVALGSAMADLLGGGVSDFMPQLGRFCKDSNDSVRLQSIPAAVGMSPHLTEGGLTQTIGLVKALSTDSAWRVRFMLADRIGAMCKAWPPKDAARVGVSIFRTQCQDQAPEIRAAAVFNLDHLVAACPTEDARKDVLAAACKLASDNTAHVRNALGASLLKAAAFTQRSNWEAHIIPTCNTLLSDGDSQVRLGLVTSFSTASDAQLQEGSNAAGLTAVAKALVPAVVALAKDSNWRVREVVVKQVPSIVQAVGSSDEMVSVCVDALTDRVATIRSAGCSAAQRLIESGGSSWSRTEFLPRIVHLAQANVFLHRVTLVHLLALAVEVAENSFVKSDLLPLLAKLGVDPVPNVRLNVAKAFKAGLASRKISLSDFEVQSTLDKLVTDKDVDVRDAALLAKAR